MSKESSVPYKGLSRAYRPQTFASVIGQDAIVTTLKNAIRLNKTAQTYLFCGTRGTGKTTLARVLAKALNCEDLTPEFEPCNKCSSCQEISQGKSLNVFEIDGASHRGIDDIRQLNETVVYAPSSSGCKIFIIDEAHMLTKEAFNALLKTLEEPPPNVKFFLATTEPHKIPPTILSRAQRFDLQRIPSSHIVQKLIQIINDQSVPYDEGALYRIASLSDGSMRVAESLLDQILCFVEGTLTEELVSSSLAILPTDSFFEFDEAFVSYNLSFAFTWASVIFSSGKDLSYFLECLLEHYRNILAIQLNVPSQDLHPSLLEKYRNSATIYTQDQTLYILDYLIQWHQHTNKTPFKRISLEMILLHLLKSKYRISAADLVCKIQELQNKTLEEDPVQSSTKPSIEKKTISFISTDQKKPTGTPPPALEEVKKNEVDPSSLIESPTKASIGSDLKKTLETQTETIEEEIKQNEPPISTPIASSIQPSILNDTKKTDEIQPPLIQEEMKLILREEIEQQSFLSSPVVLAPTIEQKTLEEKPEKKTIKTPSPEEKAKAISTNNQARYDTLMRFASVELEGLLTKGS